MDLDEIRDLAALMDEFSLTAVKIDTHKDGSTSIKLERNPMQTLQSSAFVKTEATNVNMPCEEDIPSGLTAVSAPVVGVFYSAPSPGASPYVSVGDKVKAGDVLCIVEAMKLMNEITAETDGIIEKVCVENGSVVEYGQTMFYLKRT